MLLNQLNVKPFGQLFRSRGNYLKPNQSAQPNFPDLSGKRALLIHSQPKKVKTISPWLHSAGMTVDVADSEEGLKPLLDRIGEYDVVIAYYEMRWLPLLELIRQIRWESRVSRRALILLTDADGRISSHVDSRLIFHLYQPLHEQALSDLLVKIFPVESMV